LGAAAVEEGGGRDMHNEVKYHAHAFLFYCCFYRTAAAALVRHAAVRCQSWTKVPVHRKVDSKKIACTQSNCIKTQ
jgi:hypothetical protein